MTDGTNNVEVAGRPIRRFWLLIPVVVFAGIAVVFGYSLQYAKPNLVPSALIGKPVPKTTFAPLEGLVKDGKPMPGFSEKDLTSSGVAIVNFWASWCGPCVAEHPQLLELAEKSGVKVFGVNYKDEPSAALKFLARYGNPYDVVGTDLPGRSTIEWGVYGMPETFVVNGWGEIVYKHVGPILPENLETVLSIVTTAKKAFQ